LIEVKKEYSYLFSQAIRLLQILLAYPDKLNEIYPEMAPL